MPPLRVRRKILTKITLRKLLLKSSASRLEKRSASTYGAYLTYLKKDDASLDFTINLRRPVDVLFLLNRLLTPSIPTIKATY